MSWWGVVMAPPKVGRVDGGTEHPLSKRSLGHLEGGQVGIDRDPGFMLFR